MKKPTLGELLYRLFFGKSDAADRAESRLVLFPKRLPEHLDAAYFEEYIRTLRMPFVWVTVLVFALVLIVICYFTAKFTYFWQWVYACAVAGVLTVAEFFWLWDLARPLGYRVQLTILNVVLGLLVTTLSAGIISSWNTMSVDYIGMMTTIIGSILGAAAVILSYSRVSYLIFMLGWIIPGLIFMFGRPEPFFIFMGLLFIAGIFSFLIINFMEYAKQRQLFDARYKLAEINDELIRKDAELDQELLFASHIQMGIFPDPKTRAGSWAFQTSVFPLGRISGDYLDIVTRGDVVFALMSDASGHGVPAAMLTMAAKNVFANTLTERISPAAAFANSNHEILKMIKTQDFMTGFLCKLYPSGLVEFSNAAHPTAFLQTLQGDIRLLDTSGFILGGLDDVDALYENASAQMHAGDRLFLYTDGIIECVNGDEHFYGMDRLEKVLRITRGLELNRVVPKIFSDMVAFCEGVPFRDDIAMMVIEYTP